jgi:UDP-glucose 4-epimerase
MKELKGKSVLVTGASGFIGSHLVRRLVQEGLDVHAVIRADATRLSDTGKITMHRGSVTDPDFIRKALDRSRPETVFHLAGVLKKDSTAESLNSNMAVNLFGTLNILESLPAKARLIFVSTAEGYAGNPPFPEESKRVPLSPYSLSKMCAENLCEFFSKAHGTPLTILRPFNVYGPGQGRGMLIPDLIISMLEGNVPKTTKGEQTRDFIFIDDLIDAFLISMKKEAAGQTLNVCTGTETKAADVSIQISRLTGGKVDIGALPYKESEVWRHFGSNKKLRSLGWKPKTDIEEGIKKTVEWYKNHRSPRDFSPE